MKRIMFILLTVASLTGSSFSNDFSADDTLNVFALSGLKLRSAPSVHSSVLEILQYGDQVKVVSTLDFEKKWQIGWVKGHWIKVDFYGLEGFLFDGYLSPLPVPLVCLQGDLQEAKLPELLNAYIQSSFVKHGSLDTLGVPFVAQGYKKLRQRRCNHAEVFYHW